MKDFFKWEPGHNSYFGLAHILVIVFGLALIVGVCFWLKKIQKEKARKILKIVFFVMLSLDPIYWTWELIVTKTLHPSTMPLYFCSLCYMVLPFALFSKKEEVKQTSLAYLATMNLFAGLMGLIFNTNLTQYSVFSFVGIRTLLYHLLMCFVSAFIWITGYYKPKIKDTFMFLIPMLIIFPFALTANLLLGTDFCFLMGGKGTPFYIVSSAMPLPCYILVFYIVDFLLINIIFYIPTIYKFIKQKRLLKLNTMVLSSSNNVEVNNDLTTKTTEEDLSITNNNEDNKKD